MNKSSTIEMVLRTGFSGTTGALSPIGTVAAGSGPVSIIASGTIR